MIKATITIRINLKDWRVLRSVYPGWRGESVASYMERLADWLEEGR